ncbi:hypothetical protein BDZ89DRAFT_1167353 [Hymenopellis radicata]|nr:hypothetical protein BDZ89DRAFT_1167353 [Hymenopellis radicata]
MDAFQSEPILPKAVILYGDGTAVEYDVFLHDGDLVSRCDLCGLPVKVGIKRNTVNLHRHRGGQPCRRNAALGTYMRKPQVSDTEGGVTPQPSIQWPQSPPTTAADSRSKTPIPSIHVLPASSPGPATPSDSSNDSIPIASDDDLPMYSIPHVPPAERDESISEITESLDDMHLHPEPPSNRFPGASKCRGALTQWLPGNAWTTYGFSRHATSVMDWEPVSITSDGKHIRLLGRGCHVILSTPEEEQRECCSVCSAVPNLASFRKFMTDAAGESKAHTPYRFLNHEQLVTLLQTKSNEERALRTRLWNKERQIRRLSKKLGDHKRVMMLLSQNDVPALRRLVAASLKRSGSSSTLLNTIQRCLTSNYRPRSGFTQRDFDKAFLSKSYGGDRMLNTLQRAEGYPSRTTLLKHHHVPQLLPSLGIPTAEEIRVNIVALLDPAVRNPPTKSSAGILPGIIVMIDGVALEEICRYESMRNVILGLCREHSKLLNLVINSIEDLEKIADALERQRDDPHACHRGKDGTVLAIATVSDSEQYTPIPLILSPSCKAETGKQLATWLRTFIDVWREHPFGEALYGPIRALASDGESSFRLARYNLCMSETVQKDQPLGQLLWDLPGLNLQTGIYNILGTCDPKHVFKRFATLLRSVSGILVDETYLVPTDIQASLMRIPGMTEHKAKGLLDPADKQNVPKAVTLLQDLHSLGTDPDIAPVVDPASQQRARAIEFLAETLMYFTKPFIDVTMDLKDQCRSLATYAHLAAAVYLKEGLNFLTSALYADSQAIVKNIFVTIAKLFIDDPNLPYYIIHEGTDRLENIFSNVRTQDHARNFDTLQLSQKLSVATEIVATCLRNPDLDLGHRRLDLVGAKGVDRINPASLKGTYTVGSVCLADEWKGGETDANALLEKTFGEEWVVDYKTRFSRASNLDFLRPDQPDAFIGSKWHASDARLEVAEKLPAENEDCEEDWEDIDDEVETPAGLEGIRDIEDQLELEEELDNGSDDATADSRTIMIDGKKFLKSSVVHVMLSAGDSERRKVTMRTLRAQGLTMDDLRKRKSDDWIAGSDDEGLMKARDPAAVLVRIDGKICLAVVEVLAFQFPGMRTYVSEASLDRLETKGDKCPLVIAQIFVMAPRDDGEESAAPNGWMWTGDYARMVSDTVEHRRTRSKQYYLRIPGYLVHPLVAAPIDDSTGHLRWYIEHQDLVDTQNYAWSVLNPDTEEIMGNLTHLPTIPTSLTTSSLLPYRWHDSTSILAVPEDQLPKHLGVKHKGTEKMRAHCGQHILYHSRKLSDPRLEGIEDVPHIGPNPCGWCGLGDTECVVQLIREGKKKTPKIYSNCDYHYETMRYQHAAEFSDTSPCTNVPIHCPICDVSVSGEQRTFWKYNAVHHALSAHSHLLGDGVLLRSVPKQFLVDTFVTSAEEHALSIDEFATVRYREDLGIPNTDGIEEERDILLGKRTSRDRGASFIHVDNREPIRQRTNSIQ